MSDASNAAKNLRERLGVNTEERLGKALGELLESPLLTGAIGRAFDARERAAQAQEVALGALNIPSAADIERLTRRLRSVSHRLEGIEDGVGRLDRALSPSAVERSELGQRLSSIEGQLASLTKALGRSEGSSSARAPASRTPRAGKRPAKAKPKKAAGKAKPAKAAGKAKPAKAARKAKPAKAAKRAGKPKTA
jgi:hypothetical protein